jgi:hypothetical protein
MITRKALRLALLIPVGFILGVGWLIGFAVVEGLYEAAFLPAPHFRT